MFNQRTSCPGPCQIHTIQEQPHLLKHLRQPLWPILEVINPWGVLSGPFHLVVPTSATMEVDSQEITHRTTGGTTLVVQDMVVTTGVDNQTVQVGEAHHTFHTMETQVTMAAMGEEDHHIIQEATVNQVSDWNVL